MPLPFGTGAVEWEATFDGYSDGVTIESTAEWGAPVATADAARSLFVENPTGTAGALTGPADAGWAGGYTETDTHGDGDYIFDIAAWPLDASQVLLELLALHEGEGGIDGYVVNIRPDAATDRLRLQRWASSASAATLIDDSSWTFTTPGYIGVRRINPLLELYRSPDRTTWTQVGASQSDAAYSAGRVMVESNSGLLRVARIQRLATEAPAGATRRRRTRRRSGAALEASRP